MDFPSLLAAADRAALGRLGVLIRYVTSTGDETEVQGFFDSADANVTVQGQELASAGPRVFILLDGLPADPQAEPKGWPKVFFGDTWYLTRDARKDGVGGVVLELAKVDA